MAIATALGAMACQSGPSLADLALRDPLPYSVLVTGGAFVQSVRDAAPEPALSRTYRPDRPEDGDYAEAFALSRVLDVLERGRVFVRAVPDDDGVSARLGRAQAARSLQSATHQGYLERARAAGHDMLLVIERLEDGPVEYRGINGQWPITASVWLMIGLGMVIPDHTYESRARVYFALRDVHTGREVYRSDLAPGAVDVALVQRTDFLGLLTSIIIPPFWVGDDDDVVEDTVRESATERLLVGLARLLKSKEYRRAAAAEIEVTQATDGFSVKVVTDQSLSFVRLRFDGRALRGATIDAFERRLLQSRQVQRGRAEYRADCPGPYADGLLQVLTQTTDGRVASVTVALPAR